MYEISGFVEKLFNKDLIFKGARVVRHSEGEVIAQIEIGKDKLNPYGELHGGIIFTLADSIAGIVCVTTGRFVVTKSASITYMKKSSGTVLEAVGKMKHAGAKTADVVVSIFDDGGALVAEAMFNMYVTGFVSGNNPCEI